MSERKIIQVGVTPMEYGLISDFCKRNKFSTITKLMRAMFGLLIWGEFTIAHEKEDADEIRAMFADLANSQTQPDGTVPVRHNKTELKHCPSPRAKR